jgi:hypothetical protein
VQSETVALSKKTYTSPQLVEWGSLTDLTLANGGSGNDALGESFTGGLVAPNLPNYGDN